MAVVVTVAKGYDLGYIWKTQDHAAERIQREHPHPAPDGQPAETAPWIRGLIMQH